MTKLTDKDRQFLAAYRRLSRTQAQAIFEMMGLWRDGAGPDMAKAEAWVLKRAAEIERTAGRA